MSWAKLSDDFYDHPKVRAAGHEGVALFVCGLSYCARHLSDGLIPNSQVRFLCDIDDAQGVAARLVEVGLWEKCDGGYLVHDYLDYNPSAAQALARRRAGAKRLAEWRRRTDGNAGSNGVTNGVSNGVSNTIPVPVPVPVPVPDPHVVVLHDNNNNTGTGENSDAMTLTQEEALASELEEVLAPEVARRLLAGYEPGRIADQLDHFRWAREHGKVIGAGWLVRAIEEDWPLPAELIGRIENAPGADGSRYISGEYAEFIQH